MANLASAVQQLKMEGINFKDGSNNSTKRCRHLAVSADCVEAEAVAGNLSVQGEKCRPPRRRIAAAQRARWARWRAGKRGKKS